MRFKKINKLLVIIIIVMQVFLLMSLRVVEIQSRYIDLASTLTLVTHIEMMRSYLVTKCFCTLLGIYDIVF